MGIVYFDDFFIYTAKKRASCIWDILDQTCCNKSISGLLTTKLWTDLFQVDCQNLLSTGLLQVVSTSYNSPSLSGKIWQDRDKADKVSISFPASPKDNWNVFGGVMKKFEKFIIPPGEKLLFWNNGSECLFMLYLIIVFNNKVLGYFSKDMDFTTDTWAFQIKYN